MKKKYYIKQTHCPYCNIDLQSLGKGQPGNHQRWCESNPKVSLYKEQSRVRFNKIKTKADLQSPEIQQKRNNAVREAWKRGAYKNMKRVSQKGMKHSQESKNNMSIAARACTHRRLVRSIRPYTMKTGEIIMLDSSWEEALAKRLDSLNITWIRPKEPIKWIDANNKSHNYFPDFYLKDFDIYLDPKNPCAAEQQKEKISILKQMLPNLIFLHKLSECNNFQPYTPVI